MRRVYLKRGNRNAQERRMEEAMSDFVENKLAADPTFDWQPARNIVELKDFYVKNCVEEATIVSETKNPPPASSGNSPQQPPVENAVPADEQKKERIFMDPMLENAPIERDYVTDANQERMDYQDNLNEPSQPSGESVKEPTSFKDAFGMPNQGDQNDKEKKEKAKERPKQEPINPSFDEMSGSRRNKQTRKFAKWATKAFCAALSKGYVMYTTKDINPSKLNEYEITNEIDLTIELSLEDDQVATVKDFFLFQCKQIEEVSKITDEERESMEDSLYEVLLEKGFTPTPMQQALMSFGAVVVRFGLDAFVRGNQINSLLSQLKDMQKQTQHAQDVTSAPPPVSEEKVPETSTELVKQEA